MTAVLSQCFNFNNAIVKWGWQTGPGPILSLECILSRSGNHFVTKSLWRNHFVTKSLATFELGRIFSQTYPGVNCAPEVCAAVLWNRPTCQICHVL